MKKSISKLVYLLLSSSILIGCSNQIISSSKEKLNPPLNLKVPTLAYDEKSILLVWEKPENYGIIEDYNVYMNGEKIGSAREQFKKTSPYTWAYMEAFYNGDKENFHHKIQIHSFKATDLQPDKEYKFSVKSVSNGVESKESNLVIKKTTPTPKIFNVVDFGAKDYGTVTDYTVNNNNEKILKNTKAIQEAIDSATPNSKVVIPKGTYVSGAIWLKSDITLELEKDAVLLGSPNADHYPSNYILYDYSTDTRAWALVNAYSYDHGQLKNIRIVGKGTIDGNGWKYVNPDKSLSDIPAFQTKDPLDPKDEKYSLPNYLAGNNRKVTDGDEHSRFQAYGILAADASKKSQAKGLSVGLAYATRPNLMVLRGVDGVYLEGFIAKNPAFHGIATLDSDNIVSNSVIYHTYDTNNGDGIELGNSKNAIVLNNFFDTGDDSINFATGMGQAVINSNQRSSSDIWIFNNFIREGHGGAIAAGSHTGGWIENLLAEDNILNRTDMPFRFKSNILNGGGVRNVVIRDSAVNAPKKQVFTFSTDYSDNNQVIQLEPAQIMPIFKDIKAYNITVSKTGKALPIEVNASLDRRWHIHKNMSFSDITFKDVDSNIKLKGLEDSQFKNIVLEGKTPIEQLWIIEHSKNLSFQGVISGTPNNKYIPELKSASKTAKEEVPLIKKDPLLYSVSNGTGYTWSTIRWNGFPQEEVESYVVKVNGKEVDKVANPKKWDEVTYTAGGLIPGVENRIEVSAIKTISKEEFNYKQLIVKTWGNYDSDAPVWSKDSKITIKKLSENSVELTWNPATDSNEILGYRIYMNGRPLKKNINEEWNPVNGNYTTKDTTFVVEGLDLSKESYNFKIEAGDIWWKSKENKAPHHWTLSGPEVKI